MAFFEGTLKEFITYIGPFARNKIQSITRKEKVGKRCEMCNRANVILQSAHILGEERNQIIERLLHESYTRIQGIYKIDLIDFSQKFIQAHMPFEKHFKFLCKSCHDKYDLRNKNPSTEDIKLHLDNLPPQKKDLLLKELGLTFIPTKIK